MLNLSRFRGTDVEPPIADGGLCSFGLVTVPLLVSAGVGAATAGAIGSAVSGAVIGGGLAAATGGKPLKGALYGGLAGGALGAAGAIFPETTAALGLSGVSGALSGGKTGAQLAGMGSNQSSASQIPDTVSVTPQVYGSHPGAYNNSGYLNASISPTPGPAATSTGLGKTLTALGALGNLAGAFQKPRAPDYSTMPGPETTAAVRGPLFDQPLGTGYFNRSANDMGGQDFYTYGMRGGTRPQFFNDNQIHFARGGALSRVRNGDNRGALSNVMQLARGGAEFDTRRGDSYVGGRGGGQDDNIRARLSPGEFVFDSGTVSAIGDGNNSEGARRLMAMRRQIANDKGFKHAVQPKLKKPPMGYLKQASR